MVPAEVEIHLCEDGRPLAQGSQVSLRVLIVSVMLAAFFGGGVGGVAVLSIAGKSVAGKRQPLQQVDIASLQQKAENLAGGYRYFEGDTCKHESTIAIPDKEHCGQAANALGLVWEDDDFKNEKFPKGCFRLSGNLGVLWNDHTVGQEYCIHRADTHALCQLKEGATYTMDDTHVLDGISWCRDKHDEGTFVDGSHYMNDVAQATVVIDKNSESPAGPGKCRVTVAELAHSGMN
jgi:hypothetical protein